jgi:hypothetical protein
MVFNAAEERNIDRDFEEIDKQHTDAWDSMWDSVPMGYKAPTDAEFELIFDQQLELYPPVLMHDAKRCPTDAFNETVTLSEHAGNESCIVNESPWVLMLQRDNLDGGREWISRYNRIMRKTGREALVITEG